MEKFSSFDRVIGKASESEKKGILLESEAMFADQIFEDLEGKEREKTPEELVIISLANDLTNEVRREYGLENFDIPEKNIHVIYKKDWPKDRGMAHYFSMLQGIAIQEEIVKVAFLKKIFHEMLHFKSYNSLQVTTDEDKNVDAYRVGLTISTRDGQRKYFNNLNEAITEEITKKYSKKLFNNSLFVEEIKQTQDLAVKYPELITDSGEKLFETDTYYAEAENNRPFTDKINIKNFSYQTERKFLDILIDKILERNSEEFNNSDEIFEVFAKGMMTGNILPLSRLIQKTFGEGVFRQIGELDDNAKVQMNFVNSL